VLQPLEGNVQYKTEDITNVNFFNYTPDAIVVRNESPFKTYQDFIAAAKAKPGALNFAGSGTNSANHAAHARLNDAAKIQTTYVAFKGTGDLISSLLGGHVDGAMSYSSLGLAQRSKTRLLAVATPQRLSYFPDVPTFRELGIDWVDGAYRGVGMPKSTPEEMRRRVSDMFSEIGRDAEFRRKMIDQGLEIVDIGYDKMASFMEERKKAYLDSAKLLGLFQVSILHNIVHLLFGIVGLALAKTADGARTFLIGGGVVYLVLWLLGIVGGGDWIPVNTADNWLHFVLGIGMVALGFVTGRDVRRTAAPA